MAYILQVGGIMVVLSIVAIGANVVISIILSIDTHTEQIIQKGMGHLMKGCTSFVIAHRLSTVRNVDDILVLKNGEIVERGDHQTLIEKKGRYHQLYTGQFD